MAAIGQPLKPTVTWAEFMQQVKNLTQMLDNMNSNQTNKYLLMLMESLGKVDQTNQALARYFSLSQRLHIYIEDI